VANIEAASRTKKKGAAAALAPPLRRDQDSGFAIPVDIAPMEARSADKIPSDGDGWQYERKWDGFRCLAFKSGEAVALRAKSGKPLGRYFPEVVALLHDLDVSQFVVDGELVMELDGRLAFDVLQTRLHPAESRIRKLAAATPAKLVLFDMLVAPDGKILIDAPLSERRQALEAFMRGAAVPRKLVLSRVTADRSQAQLWLGEAGQGSTDGVVAKRLADSYHPGERTMIKVKRLRTADCVVGGFRYESGSREVGSLLLGLYNQDGKLDHVGFTSTISDEERSALTKKLQRLRGPPGFTGNAPGGPSRWSTEQSGEWEPLQPKLVVEVRFDHVTANRFRHGTKLLRWRPDKDPKQCTMEQLGGAPAAAV
jgi:ATP-dependent DNA ligase